MALSKPAAERAQRITVTLILVIGAIPIALPLVWLVVSSLKTAEEVLTETPTWLPIVERYLTSSDGRDVEVSVASRGFADALGVWRVKPADAGDEPWFYWPTDQIGVVEKRGHVARIGWIERAVTPPQPADKPGYVRVGQLGTQRRVAVAPDALQRRLEVRQAITLFGMTLPVALESDEAGGARLHVLDTSDPLEVAQGRLTTLAAGTWLHLPTLGDVRFRVEVIATLADAGVQRIRFVPGVVENWQRAYLPPQEQTLERYYLDRGGELVEVKPTRRDERGWPIEVAVVDEPKIWTVPADDVRAVTSTQQRVTWLGQSLTVRVRDDVDAPPGMVALQTVAPHDAVSVATAQVRHEREIAPQWWNYVNVFRTEPLHKYVLNTVFITALSIIGNVLSCGIVGYAFARLQFRGKNVLFMIVLSTMMLPTTITFLPTYILYVKIGWLDTFLPLVVPTYLATAAFFVFLYRQFFMTIPLDLEDAARIDGCDPLRTFWHIMLPMARPAVVTVTVFTFMAAWNDFMGPLLYINTDEYQTLAYGLYSFKSSFGYKFPHYMMAASTMMMIPTLIIFFLAQKAFMRGVVVTGVKG